MQSQRGIVAAFDPATGCGVIVGASRQSYHFSGADLTGAPGGVAVGQWVTFEASGAQARAIAPAAGASRKERVAAGLMALLVGAFGIHKLYLGRYWAGGLVLALAAVSLVAMFVLPWIVLGDLQRGLQSGRAPTAGDFVPLLWLILPHLVMLALWVIGVVEGLIYLVKDEMRFQAEYVVGRRAWF